jgi:hypothetical protein
VPLGGGASATISALGTIESNSGLGGEATSVNATHFTVSATLDGMEEAVLLVSVGE